MNRAGDVFFYEQLAGVIFEDENGCHFQYDSDYLKQEKAFHEQIQTSPKLHDYPESFFCKCSKQALSWFFLLIICYDSHQALYLNGFRQGIKGFYGKLIVSGYKKHFKIIIRNLPTTSQTHLWQVFQCQEIINQNDNIAGIQAQTTISKICQQPEYPGN